MKRLLVQVSSRCCQLDELHPRVLAWRARAVACSRAVAEVERAERRRCDVVQERGRAPLGRRERVRGSLPLPHLCYPCQLTGDTHSQISLLQGTMYSNSRCYNDNNPVTVHSNLLLLLSSLSTYRIVLDLPSELIAALSLLYLTAHSPPPLPARAHGQTIQTNRPLPPFLRPRQLSYTSFPYRETTAGFHRSTPESRG